MIKNESLIRFENSIYTKYKIIKQRLLTGFNKKNEMLKKILQKGYEEIIDNFLLMACQLIM